MGNALIEYDMTIMEYPWHYEDCPLLPMEVIHHFLLRSGSTIVVRQALRELLHFLSPLNTISSQIRRASMFYNTYMQVSAKIFTIHEKLQEIIFVSAAETFLILWLPSEIYASVLCCWDIPASQSFH
ncbi:unnamed protein product [Fraxinus pennsylvanica]|uniref:Uncharacterized protein n=1 Tax=Fraxinus pennsylvanica TaxID=56036 RepID=A0AAD2AB13_9LAMI|nr:unnamed protein product [Fraxinus pennsylvanica]